MNGLMKSLRAENTGMRALAGQGEPGLFTLLGGTAVENDASNLTFTGGAGQVSSVSRLAQAHRDSRLAAVASSSGSRPGGGGGGDRCVHVDSFLPGGMRAGDLCIGDSMALEETIGSVTYSKRKHATCYRVVTESGVSLVCSESAPIPVFGGGYATPPTLIAKKVPVMVDGVTRWEIVARVELLGAMDVQHITVGDRCFWAGEHPGAYLLHHNAKPIDL